LRGQSFIKHSALRAAVHKDLVKTGEWTIELGKDYDLVMFLRQTGDYAGTAHVSKENARRAVEAAQRIITACQEELSSLDS
jgi:uncharacterized protein (UPF0332 family)